MDVRLMAPFLQTTGWGRGRCSPAKHCAILSLWFRHLTRRLRVEAETVGITACGSFVTDGTQVPAEDEVAEKISNNRDGRCPPAGGSLETDYTLKGGKITVGFDARYASGDSHAGWGLRPGTGQLGGSGRAFMETLGSLVVEITKKSPTQR